MRKTKTPAKQKPHRKGSLLLVLPFLLVVAIGAIVLLKPHGVKGMVVTDIVYKDDTPYSRDAEQLCHTITEKFKTAGGTVDTSSRQGMLMINIEQEDDHLLAYLMDTTAGKTYSLMSNGLVEGEQKKRWVEEAGQNLFQQFADYYNK